MLDHWIFTGTLVLAEVILIVTAIIVIQFIVKECRVPEKQEKYGCIELVSGGSYQNTYDRYPVGTNMQTNLDPAVEIYGPYLQPKKQGNKTEDPLGLNNGTEIYEDLRYSILQD